MVGGGVDKKSHHISLDFLDPKWRITATARDPLQEQDALFASNDDWR